MAHKRRGAFKGHCALCAWNKGNWRRGTIDHPASVKRFTGKARRAKRHQIPSDQLDIAPRCNVGLG